MKVLSKLLILVFITTLIYYLITTIRSSYNIDTIVNLNKDLNLALAIRIFILSFIIAILIVIVVVILIIIRYINTSNFNIIINNILESI